MAFISPILFVLMAGFAIFWFSKNALIIRRNILLGKDEVIETDVATRCKNLILLALGQKKMFNNPTVALLHLLVYVGFIIINIEVLEIVLDGILGTHRLFSPWLLAFTLF